MKRRWGRVRDILASGGLSLLISPPPDDNDSECWKALALRRGEEYNRLADQITEAWAELAEARSAAEARTADYQDRASERQIKLEAAEQALRERDRILGWVLDWFENFEAKPEHEGVDVSGIETICNAIAALADAAEDRAASSEQALREIAGFAKRIDRGLCGTAGVEGADDDAIEHARALAAAIIGTAALPEPAPGDK